MKNKVMADITIGTFKKDDFHDYKSEWAKEANIRISQPFGYFPEDVDLYIKKLEEKIKMTEVDEKIAKLEKENENLRSQIEFFKIKSEKEELQRENMCLKKALNEETNNRIEAEKKLETESNKVRKLQNELTKLKMAVSIDGLPSLK